MTDLQEIKDAWAIEKVKPQDKQITHEQIDWLIAEVERLEGILTFKRSSSGD